MSIFTNSLIVISLLAAATPALAQEIVSAREYRACMKLAR